jgi:hypothetical protein
MTRRVLPWALLVLALAASPIDDWLDRTMPRLLLVEMPAWIALGWVAARRSRAEARPWNPYGLTGLAFFLGALGFWMIPRSVDAIGASEVVDQTMHASLLLAGAALASSVPLMPFVVRAALGIYGASMTLSLGMVYASWSSLLCGTFDLSQQRAAGHWLLVACPFVVLLVIGCGARALDRESRRLVAS